MLLVVNVWWEFSIYSTPGLRLYCSCPPPSSLFFVSLLLSRTSNPLASSYPIWTARGLQGSSRLPPTHTLGLYRPLSSALPPVTRRLSSGLG